MDSEQAPPDWVLIKAQKLCDWTAIGSPEQLRLRYKTAGQYSSGPPFAALCDMIWKHEQPPVGRKLLCAREAKAQDCGYKPGSKNYKEVLSGKHDALFEVDFDLCFRAIELWEEGFGK